MASRKGRAAFRHSLAIPAAAAGSANDIVGATFIYDAFAHLGKTASGPAFGYDPATENVIEMCFTTGVALVGQATNFVSPRVSHRDATGALKNSVSIVFSSAGVATVAFVPVQLVGANGIVATGAGTGVLAVTGIAVPWPLVAGDTITLDRLSNNATGLATPAMSLTFLLGIGIN
jgi:hypothetical protein